MGSNMPKMRFGSAIKLGVVALGLVLLACTDATKVNSNPPQTPIQVSKGELAELSKLAAAQAGPTPNIPCDVGEPPGEKFDFGAEAAPLEDPYAG